MSKPYYPGEQPGLEVGVPSMAAMPPQQIHPDYMAYQSPYYQAASKEAPPYIPQQQPATPESNRICGLPTRIFWVVFAVVLLVLGAALGAGLGAGLSAHKTAHLPDNSGSASSSGTPEQQQSTSHSVYAYPTAYSTTTSSSAPTSTIQPFSTKPGTYRIVNVATYNALDLYLGGTTNGTEIECWQWSGAVYSPLSENPHQAWLISSVGNNLITIYNSASQSYLTAPAGLVSGPGSGGGATYGGVPGNPSDPHTQFTIIQNSDNSIRFQSNAYPMKLLDLDDSGTANGTPVLVWEMNGETGSDNQHWILTTE